MKEDPDLRPTGAFSMRGHSIGGFGSVTTNKVIATIGGQVFGKDVQAYPKYGSEKKGLPTTYYLTIADSHIYSHSELEYVEPGRAQRHDGPVQRQSAGRAGGGRGDLHAEPVHESGRRLAADSDARQEHDPREAAARVSSSTWCRLPARWPRRPTCRCGCRASCCWGRF